MGPKDYLLIVDHLQNCVEIFNDEHLRAIFEIVSSLGRENDGFEHCRIAVRDELDRRRQAGTLTPHKEY